MEADRWARLEELFAAAEPLGPEARRNFLDLAFAAAPDPELRRELEAMLPFSGGGRVEGAIAGGLALFAEDEAPPALLGPWRLGEELGRGGMATVYAAWRDDQEFELGAAVKILRRGMDTADVVRRLRRERQILASLDHPHIARLLDGGRAADGRPYVVMERIAGEPIDAYCSSRSLGLRERLELFRRVCEAVHFAHRKLILHRDIKPSNILVGADGAPKLLDFGIAKVLAGDDATAGESAEPTLTGLRLLTPEWASPEQVRGEPLSTGSDVYSLGLLLYLLATGRRAYRVDPRRPAELERVVCEENPAPPGLGDDLDLVILAALHKDPARRYASAEQLGEDVRRYLENLPVLARKDTLGYRAAKFVRRHRLAVAAVAAVFATLLAAAIVTTWQASVARAERARAEESLARAEEVQAFLTGLFEVADPAAARGQPPTVFEVLDRGVARLRFSLRDDDRRRADLLGTLGRVYQQLGSYEKAGELLSEALELRVAGAGDAAALAASRRDLAGLELERGRLEPAAALAEAALAASREGMASADPVAALATARGLRLLADIERARARPREAARFYTEALALEQGPAGASAEEIALTRNSLGELHYGEGAFAEARAIFAAVLADRRRALPADHPELATSLNNLAAAELALGQGAAARDLLREALAIRRRVFGERHDAVATTLNNLAAVEAELGELDAAIADLGAALAINRQAYGGAHPVVAANLNSLASFHQRRQDFAEADRLYREALEMRRATLGPRHPLVAETLRNLGELAERASPQEAEQRFREALAIGREALPGSAAVVADSLAGLGRLAGGRGELAAAEAFYRQELELRDGAGPAGWRRPAAELRLGRLLASGGRREEALALMEAAVAKLEKELGDGDPRVKTAAVWLAEVRAARP